jgi:hypothetical protein
MLAIYAKMVYNEGGSTGIFYYGKVVNMNA